jgi:hypothetical protein
MLQATGLPAPCPGQPRSQMWSGNRGRSCGPATVVAIVVATVVRQPWSQSWSQLWSGNRGRNRGPATSGNLFRRGSRCGSHSGSGRCRVDTPHFEPRRYSLSPVLRAQGVRSGLEVGWRPRGGANHGGRVGWGGITRRWEFGEGAIRRPGSVTGVPEGRWQDANAREP